MWRGAIIGLGNVAIEGHLPAWRARDDVELVAATDARPVQRARCASHLPDARWHDSVDELLARGALHFVDVCTPPASHAAIVRAALERGLHVLCEKPLVRALDELPPIADLARTSGRVLHTVHNWHHAPIVRTATDLVEGGEIGAVRRVTWHTLRTKPAGTADAMGGNWRLDPAIAGGGVLSDHGWHVCYVIARWVGAWPVSVSARLETRRHTHSAVEDTATLTLTFPEATADVLLTWAADERRNWALLEGESGRIELHDDVLVLARDGVERRWSCPPLSGGSHHPEWFGAVAESFIGAMSGAILPDMNLREATLCATVESLARESSRQEGSTLMLAAPILGHPVASGLR
jgi:predicted dehydrogenase